MESFVDEYDLTLAKKFLKGMKNKKYECYYKMIMAYSLTRHELLNLEWKDIDFENNTITFYPVFYPKDYTNNAPYNYQWQRLKDVELGRTFPLLPCLRKMLIKIKNERIYDVPMVCIRKDGSLMNANTLSRNVRYIARDCGLPQTLISGIKKSCHAFYLKHSPSYEFFRCWTRFDVEFRKENLYPNLDLTKNKKFIELVDNFIDTGNFDLRNKKKEAEMWG